MAYDDFILLESSDLHSLSLILSVLINAFLLVTSSGWSAQGLVRWKSYETLQTAKLNFQLRVQLTTCSEEFVIIRNDDIESINEPISKQPLLTPLINHFEFGGGVCIPVYTQLTITRLSMEKHQVSATPSYTWDGRVFPRKENSVWVVWGTLVIYNPFDRLITGWLSY
jgi:hypothetical protein